MYGITRFVVIAELDGRTDGIAVAGRACSGAAGLFIVGAEEGVFFLSLKPPPVSSGTKVSLTVTRNSPVGLHGHQPMR